MIRKLSVGCFHALLSIHECSAVLYYCQLERAYVNTEINFKINFSESENRIKLYSREFLILFMVYNFTVALFRMKWLCELFSSLLILITSIFIKKIDLSSNLFIF